ncbi:MAG: hypothetical protein Q4C49_01975 [Bacillota bacterium]|nr:hypothetical protein [Bacillota bacterium]
MKKYIGCIMAFLLSFTMMACQNQNKIKEEIDKVDSQTPKEEMNKTESEKKEDENYEQLKNDEKVNVKDITGEYEIVIYTISGTTIVKGSEEWIDIFGEESDEDKDESISIKIIDKVNMHFNIYGDIMKTEYTLDGNLIKWLVEEDGELTVTKGLLVDDCLVIDLDGSKMYFAKREDPEGISKAEKLCKRIESGEFEKEEKMILEEEIREDN